MQVCWSMSTKFRAKFVADSEMAKFPAKLHDSRVFTLNKKVWWFLQVVKTANTDEEEEKALQREYYF